MKLIDADALITFFEGARKMLNPSDYKTADEFNTRDLILLNVIQVIRSFPEVKAVPVESADIGDYPDTIPNQFDNMTGSMNL